MSKSRKSISSARFLSVARERQRRSIAERIVNFQHLFLGCSLMVLTRQASTNVVSPAPIADVARGTIVVAVAAFLVAMVALAAFVVDVGHWYAVRGQMQNSADAAAIAGAQRLVSDELVAANANYSQLLEAAREAARTFARYNHVELSGPELHPADITFGHVADPSDPESFAPTDDPAFINAVRVRVRKANGWNNPAASFFSKIWGCLGLSMSVQATAVTSSSVEGFRVNDAIGSAKLVPFALKLSEWNALVNGQGSDDWSWDADDQRAYYGTADGIREISLYPLENVCSGNFGTVDIGNPNNSTSDLRRQIRYGVTEEDLEYFGGEFALGPDGTLTVNGDTCVSTSVRFDLEEIIGQPRVVPLYSQVSGRGNNATYTIVGFAGVRIMGVQLTGPLSKRRVVVQPAVVVDQSAIIGETPSQSRYVFSVVRLVQ